jgi:hypothetical protein
MSIGRRANRVAVSGKNPKKTTTNQEESGPGLGTVLAVEAAATAIGVGLAALFGAFNRPNPRR